MSKSILSTCSNLSLEYKSFQPSQSVCSFEIATPTWFHNLPIKVLVNIFQYFTENELIKSIIPVCQHWKFAANRPELWKTLKIFSEAVPTNYICDRIRCLRELQTVILDRISEPIFVIRQVCRCLPELKHVSIRHCPALPEGALRYLIKSCTQLETLDLSGTDFKGNRFYQELATLSNLKSINFSDNRYITARNLLSVVLNCRYLEELRISRYISERDQLSDEDVAFMVTNVSHQLKSLTLDASTLTDVTFQSILNCKKLKKLGFYGATNLSGHMFVRLWESCPNLTHLKIRQAHQITGQHVKQLFSKGREVLKDLTLLDLSGCWKILDIGIEAIAESCPRLETVSLKSCKSITSIRSICDKCKQMKHLNIAFCQKLNSKSIYPLPDSLETFVIDENSKFNSLIKQLKINRKDLKLLASVSEYNKTFKKINLNPTGDN